GGRQLRVRVHPARRQRRRGPDAGLRSPARRRPGDLGLQRRRPARPLPAGRLPRRVSRTHHRPRGEPRMTQWYYSDYEHNRHGPVGDADMAGLQAGGQLAPDTLVWREGLAQWQPWRSLAHEVAAPAAPAHAGFATAPADAPAGFAANPYAAAEPRSPYAPPRAPVQRMAEVYLDGNVVHAGFWKRVAAYFIDAVIVG